MCCVLVVQAQPSGDKELRFRALTESAYGLPLVGHATPIYRQDFHKFFFWLSFQGSVRVCDPVEGMAWATSGTLIQAGSAE